MSLERVLVVHNAYQQAGGEDSVVADEVALLRRAGHDVVELRQHNDAIAHMHPLRVAGGAVWSRGTHAEALELVRRHRPDVAHVHNTFPLVSPALYWALAECGVPVVQTLHNFRLACPQGMFLREGRVCEDCLGKLPLPAVRHGCYRQSRPQTVVLATMLVVHRALGTYVDKVARYIVLNDFCREKFVAAGLPAERLVVVPNFIDLPTTDAPLPPRHGMLYVGRLSAEKGLGTLRAAAAMSNGVALSVMGTGPLSATVTGLAGCDFLGPRPPADVLAAMRRATALVLPSIWYENHPRTLVEAFACGLPVIASRIGALAGMVEHGNTGLLVEPGDARALAEAMQWATSHPLEMAAMGVAARQHHDQHHTGATHLAQLRTVYRSAMAELRAASWPTPATA